jgi:hypothetical protein
MFRLQTLMGLALSVAPGISVLALRQAGGARVEVAPITTAPNCHIPDQSDQPSRASARRVDRNCFRDTEANVTGCPHRDQGATAIRPPTAARRIRTELRWCCPPRRQGVRCAVETILAPYLEI